MRVQVRLDSLKTIKLMNFGKNWKLKLAGIARWEEGIVHLKDVCQI